MMEDKEDPLESIVKKHHTKRSSLFGGDHGKVHHQRGKLCIKLKFPKEEEDEDAYKHKMMIGNTTSREVSEEEDNSQHQLQQNQNNGENGTVPVTNARICQVCGKGFKSGKALGGHMRVHFQPNKDLIFTTKKFSQPIIKKLRKLKKREKRSDFFVSKKPNYSHKSQSEDGLDHEDYPCSICGKNFPSMKSLSGHMRCHPEREWRGIQPPSFSPPVYNKVGSPSSSVSVPDQSQYSSDDDNDDTDMVDDQENVGETDDLSKSLGNCWSLTAKRGRKSILDIKAKEEADEDDDEKNAVCQLMSLAQGGFFDAYSQSVVKEEFEITNSNYEGIDRRMVSVDESKKKKRRRKKYDHHLVEELHRNEDDSKKKKSDLGVGIGIGTVIIEDHKGHVKKGVQGTDFLAGGKELEMNINWPGECAAEKKDFWNDDDGDDDSEKTHDNQQLMNLQLLKHSDSITSPGNLMVGVKSKKKRKKKKMKLTDLESVHHHDHDLPPHSTAAALTVQAKGNSSSPELEKFRCTTCDKCFSTHQALGGHRSSHNKSRVIIENALDYDDSTTATNEHEDNDQEDDENPAMEGIKELSSDDQQAEGAGSNSSNSKGPMLAEENGCGGGELDYHLCKICNKVFPSGQALGGHKRCHWINNATRNPVTSSAGFEEAAISHSGHHKVVEFDLNEKPPVEDADHDDVGGGTTGCGYASSNSIEYPFF